MKLLFRIVACLFFLMSLMACGLFLPRANDFSVNAEPTLDITQVEDADAELDDDLSGVSTELEEAEEPEDICEAKPNKIANTDNMWVYYGSSTPEYAPLTPEEQMAVVGLGFGPNESASCSGTLVKSSWVLTAQHCIQGNSAGNVFVLFGPDDTNPVLRAPVQEIIQYNGHDMALLRLVSEPATSIDVTPVPVWSGDFSNNDVGRLMEQAGYGRTETGQGQGRQFVAEPLYGFENNGNVHVVNGEGQHGVCFGDSGGPSMLVTDEGQIAVAGVLSWGDPSCVGLDRYARVDVVRDWLVDQIGPLDAEVLPRSCEDLPEEGRCDANQARVFRCVDDALEVESCTEGTYCGYDADTSTWDCVTAEEDACEGLTFQGSCGENGDLRWCENGVVKDRPCGQCDERCAYQDAVIGNACEPDPCEGVDYVGYCDGDTAVWCENESTLRQEECASQGQACRYLGEERGFTCAPSCGGDLDYLGYCDGNVLRWCDRNGRTRERDCTPRGEECAWVSDSVGHNCVD